MLLLEYLIEIHNPIPWSNNIILIKVMAVTSGKYSDSDTDHSGLVTLSDLYSNWMIKTSQVALYCMELQNTQHSRNVCAV